MLGIIPPPFMQLCCDTFLPNLPDERIQVASFRMMTPPFHMVSDDGQTVLLGVLRTVLYKQKGSCSFRPYNEWACLDRCT